MLYVVTDKPDETEMAELFLREAILMKDFHHVHVLGVIGVSFDSDASPMVILPYMANGDLRQYITSAQLVRLLMLKIHYTRFSITSPSTGKLPIC